MPALGAYRQHRKAGGQQGRQALTLRPGLQGRQDHLRLTFALVDRQQALLRRQLSSLPIREVEPQGEVLHHVILTGHQHVPGQKDVAVPVDKLRAVDGDADGVDAHDLGQRQSYAVVGNGKLHAGQLAVGSGEIHPRSAGGDLTSQ